MVLISMEVNVQQLLHKQYFLNILYPFFDYNFLLISAYANIHWQCPTMPFYQVAVIRTFRWHLWKIKLKFLHQMAEDRSPNLHLKYFWAKILYKNSFINVVHNHYHKMAHFRKTKWTMLEFHAYRVTWTTTVKCH